MALNPIVLRHHTASANWFMKTVHRRIPVILAKSEYEDWLNKQPAQEDRDRLMLNDSYHEMAPIRNRVNKSTS